MEKDVDPLGDEKNTEESTGFHDERGVRASKEEMAWPTDEESADVPTRGLGEFPPAPVSEDPNSLDPSLNPVLPDSDGRTASADADVDGAGTSRGAAQGAA